MSNQELNFLLDELRLHSNPVNIAGMARYGIITENALGVSMPILRAIAKRINKNHQLALKLWASGIHEARVLAGLVAEPSQTDRLTVMKWTEELNSWDICDQLCMNLLSKTADARKLAVELSKHEREFTKRAGFALMAVLAVHDKKAPDNVFEHFLMIIERESCDGRNFVKKAVNWALRNIGKKNLELHVKAMCVAEKLTLSADKSARWIGSNALRELRDLKIIARIKPKK
jgi:3-methyladenine DNA glycosylase AlkD